MKNQDEILKLQISDQIALEEHLYKLIQEQIVEIDELDFADAKNILENTIEVLERHFTPLNELLDKIEKKDLNLKVSDNLPNGKSFASLPDLERKKKQISKILRDDYSALNLITISNTLLHTTALALQSQEVAALALKHLENLTPLVVRMGELMPVVVARELFKDSSSIDMSIAQTALKNTQLAWRRAS